MVVGKKALWIIVIGLVLCQGCRSVEKSSDDKPLTVLLMADPQVNMLPASPGNIKTAMDDVVTLDYDFMAVLGDLVQHDTKYYKDYNELIVQRAGKPVYPVAGNGDLTPQTGPGTIKFGLGLEGFKKYTGAKPYYTVYERGVRFIFLSVFDLSGEQSHICHFGPEQMEWLAKELVADEKSTTVIFAHPPVFETTWNSGEMKVPMYLYESEQMRDLFKKYGNIKIYAHGHNHEAYGLVDKSGRGGYYKEGDVLHISVGATTSNQGSSVLYIDENGITVKVRDHENHSWRKEYEYVYPVKTTLKPIAARVKI